MIDTIFTVMSDLAVHLKLLQREGKFALELKNHIALAAAGYKGKQFIVSKI